MPTREQLKNIGGLLLSGSIFCATASTGGAASVVGVLANTIAGELAANNFAGLSSKGYEKLLERLEKADPGAVNHDLERLFRASSVTALEFIKSLFLGQVKEDERITGLDNKERRDFKKHLTLFFDETIRDLKIISENNKEPVDRSLFKNPSGYLDNIVDQIFRLSSVSFDEETEDKLRVFYRERLPYCFELAFKESLKNDEKGFRAFQVWMLEEMQQQQVRIVAGQLRIETALEQLRNGNSLLSPAEKDAVLDGVADRIYTLLEKYITGIKDQLLELSSAINRDFKKQYEISEAILDKVTGIDEKINNINRKKIIPHHLVSPLPPFPEVFLGRDKELEDIRRILFEGNNLLLLVNGQGGIGKTSIAATYYHKYSGLYNHAAWVLSEKSITNALLLLAQALQVEFDEKMPANERCDILLKAMTELDRPCLLVIDNANELEDLADFYLKLRACSNFHLLLTTRISGFQQAKTYIIEGLPEDKALELFTLYYPKHQAGDTLVFKDIWLATGRNTLLTELLAKTLTVLNGNEITYSLTDLLQGLQTKGILAIETAEVETGYQAKGKLKQATATEIIEAMYDLQGLSPEEVDMLSVFTVLPAENIGYAALKKLLNADGAKALSGTLTLLHKKGWLDKSEIESSSYYKISPVIQEIVQRKNEKLLQSCRQLISGLAGMLDYEAGTGHLINSSYDEAILYARYGESAVKKLKKPDYGISVLCEYIGRYFTTTGNLDKALEYYEAEVEVFNEQYEADPQNVSFKKGLAVSYEKLGETQASLGNLDKALEYYVYYNQLSKELYEAYPQNESFKNGLAVSYVKLGETQASLGNLDKALEYYEQDAQLFKELYEADPQNVSFKNGLAVSYIKLGETQASLGNLDKALEYYKQDAQLSKELYDADPQNVSFKNGLAISYSKLGETQASLGNFDKALEYYEERSRIGKELYEAYPQNVSFKNGLAISYSKLGETQASLGNLDKALEYYEAEVKLFNELYEAYPKIVSFKNGLAVSYSRLGETQASLGNLDKALEYYEDGVKLFKELYEADLQNVSFKNGLAISYSQLALHYKGINAKDKAMEYIGLCIIIWKELTTNFPSYAEFSNNYQWALREGDKIDKM